MKKKYRQIGVRMKKDWQLYLFLLIPVIYIIIYRYVPMGGVVIAFKDYKVRKGVPEYRISRENDYYLRGKEYLTTIVMLSRADCFIGGRTSGTVGMMLLSDGFEYSYVYNLGRYGMDGFSE